MTELDLYKFLVDNKVETDWRGDKLIIWASHYELGDFAELLGSDYLSDGGVDVNLRPYGYVAIELNDICEHFEIDPERIHPKE